MNIITIAGRLGKDAEIRTTSSGKPVASFSVADDQGREKGTIWWNCQLWGERGEKLAQYLRKGSPVTVTGSLSEREYEGKKYFDVRVNDVALQGGKQDSEAPAPRQASAPAQRQAAPAQRAPSGFDDMDSEIPFIDPLKFRGVHLVL